MTLGSSSYGTKSSAVCTKDGCTKPLRAKGLCGMHFMRTVATTDGVRTGSRPKLNAEQCAAIRKRSSQFATHREIAAEFGVSAPTVGKVLKGTYVPSDAEVVR